MSEKDSNRKIDSLAKILPNHFSLTPFLTLALIVGSFFLGSLYTKVQILEKGGTVQGINTQAAQSAPQNNQPTPAPTKANVDLGHLPIKGNKDAKVTIIEFADLRCPFCEQFFKTTEAQIMKDYVDTGKAKFAFRHFAFLGPASTTAANAAECANEQGKFWDMHDYLYKNQPSESDTSMFTSDKLTDIAKTLGLNTSQFKSCLDAKKYDKNVSDDYNAGQQAGVSGTPTVFINGTPIVGAEPYNVFQAAIDAELR